MRTCPALSGASAWWGQGEQVTPTTTWTPVVVSPESQGPKHTLWAWHSRASWRSIRDWGSRDWSESREGTTASPHDPRGSWKQWASHRTTHLACLTLSHPQRTLTEPQGTLGQPWRALWPFMVDTQPLTGYTQVDRTILSGKVMSTGRATKVSTTLWLDHGTPLNRPEQVTLSSS